MSDSSILPPELTTTEFVCETWGVGEIAIHRYAPVTRDASGAIWIHPTLAKEMPWKDITTRATRIWSASGSLWNPRSLRLIYRAAAAAPRRVSTPP